MTTDETLAACERDLKRGDRLAARRQLAALDGELNPTQAKRRDRLKRQSGLDPQMLLVAIAAVLTGLFAIIISYTT